MNNEITIAIVGVIAALSGTISGGFISYLSNNRLKMKDWKLSRLRDEIDHRKSIYASFLAETDKCVLNSEIVKNDISGTLHKMACVYTKMELTSDNSVVEKAKKLLDRAVSSLCENNDTNDLLYYNLKQEFINAIKAEIKNLENT